MRIITDISRAFLNRELSKVATRDIVHSITIAKAICDDIGPMDNEVSTRESHSRSGPTSLGGTQTLNSYPKSATYKKGPLISDNFSGAICQTNYFGDAVGERVNFMTDLVPMDVAEVKRLTKAWHRYTFPKEYNRVGMHNPSNPLSGWTSMGHHFSDDELLLLSTKEAFILYYGYVGVLRCR